LVVLGVALAWIASMWATPATAASSKLKPLSVSDRPGEVLCDRELGDDGFSTARVGEVGLAGTVLLPQLVEGHADRAHRERREAASVARDDRRLEGQRPLLLSRLSRLHRLAWASPFAELPSAGAAFRNGRLHRTTRRLFVLDRTRSGGRYFYRVRAFAGSRRNTSR
jgi:hypothetical protein